MPFRFSLRTVLLFDEQSHPGTHDRPGEPLSKGPVCRAASPLQLPKEEKRHTLEKEHWHRCTITSNKQTVYLNGMY
jgi:hypothetical protein